MAHETDDARDVADDVQLAPQSIQDSLTTKLTPAEQRLGVTSRKVAFCASPHPCSPPPWVRSSGGTCGW